MVDVRQRPVSLVSSACQCRLVMVSLTQIRVCPSEQVAEPHADRADLLVRLGAHLLAMPGNVSEAES